MLSWRRSQLRSKGRYEKVTYWDIWLVGEHFSWRGEQEYINRKRRYRYKWENLLLNFYFPVKDEMREVHISSCLEFFKKPQETNITSWIREALELDKDSKYADFKFPALYEPGSYLVGHDRTQDEYV